MSVLLPAWEAWQAGNAEVLFILKFFQHRLLRFFHEGFTNKNLRKEDQWENEIVILLLALKCWLLKMQIILLILTELGTKTHFRSKTLPFFSSVKVSTENYILDEDCSNKRIEDFVLCVWILFVRKCQEALFYLKVFDMETHNFFERCSIYSTEMSVEKTPFE